MEIQGQPRNPGHFHADNPDRWPARQRKADWCQKYLRLVSNAAILDLGCGDRLIDICHSRMGCKVLAVDRRGSVLDAARAQDDTGKVEFIAADIRQFQFEEKSINAVLVLETIGLMDKVHESTPLARIYQSLPPSGKIIIDCCEFAGAPNSWAKKFPQGEVSCRSTFDSTRLQHHRILVHADRR